MTVLPKALKSVFAPVAVNVAPGSTLRPPLRVEFPAVTVKVPPAMSKAAVLVMLSMEVLEPL